MDDAIEDFAYEPPCAVCGHWEELHFRSDNGTDDFCNAMQGECDCPGYAAPAPSSATEGDGHG